jgi:protein-S-isoprenylcysteine O-methyltransferase Ste14
VRLYQYVVVLWAASEVVIGITRAAPLGFRRQDRFSGQALVGCLVLALWAGYFIGRAVPGAAITEGRDLVFGIGIARALAGIALRWYAVIVLGRFFTTSVITTPDQTVVQRGPYRLVRHPSYSGLLLTALGLLLCSTNWLSLACFAIALPGFAYRIQVEEGVLTAALGDAYRDYMRHTKRLVPFVV